MAGFQRFEEIEAWQMARELTRMVYAQSGKGEFKSDFALRDQIRKAAVSIMSNIAEGFERVSPREFAYHVGVAKGSAGEVRAQLYVALDQGYVNDEMFARMQDRAGRTGKMLHRLGEYLARQGSKKVKG